MPCVGVLLLPDVYKRQVLGRFAGCTLGVPVEGWDIDRMKDLAAYTGMPFPPKDYWTQAEIPWGVQYGRCLLYTSRCV